MITAYLRLVLHYLHSRHRTILAHRVLQARIYRIVCLVGLDKHFASEVAQIALYLAIRLGVHSFSLEVGTDFGSQFRLINIQRCFVGSDEQVAHEHGVELYVGTTEVECPCHFVEHGDKYGISAALDALGTYSPYLACCRLASKFEWLDEHLVYREFRTVGPYLTIRFDTGIEVQSVDGKFRFQVFDSSNSVDPSVNSNGTALGKSLAQPLCYGRRSLNLVFHQDIACATDLVFCL